MAGRYTRTSLQRRLHHAGHRLSHALHPLARHALVYRPRMWWIPRLPVALHPRRRSPATPWTGPVPAPPPALLTGPGVELLPDAQRAAFEEAPLHDFIRLHPDMRSPTSPTSEMWVSLLSTSPRLQAAARRRARFVREHLPGRLHEVDPADLTRRLHAEAARLGLSAVGVTAYDIRYNFAEYHGLNVGDTMIIGILEQNYDSTQTSPSIRAEKAALTAYAGLEDRMVELARWLHDQGYQARPEGFVGESMAIAYAVAAGLGQLGLNGQLLTPHAGSRCRLHVLSTDAPLVHDAPVDLGIEGVCNSCQICVRRCPPGAIPAMRKESRGVVKAKINTKRCLPVMGKASGCSVCMKVCPVQRYGLGAVLEEFEATGTILGKGTDDLEGYDWPIDGAHYAPGSTPRITADILAMPGFDFDPARTEPPRARPEPTGEDALGALGY